MAKKKKRLHLLLPRLLLPPHLWKLHLLRPPPLRLLTLLLPLPQRLLLTLLLLLLPRLLLKPSPKRKSSNLQFPDTKKAADAAFFVGKKDLIAITSGHPPTGSRFFQIG